MAVPFLYRRRVSFAETDMAGILHFSNTFRMVEEAEAAFYREALQQPLFCDGAAIVTGFPRRSASARYHAPARFGDELEISLTVNEVRSAGISYRATLRRVSPAPELLIAEAEMVTVHARLDRATGQMAAIPLPDSLRAALAPWLADAPAP